MKTNFYIYVSFFRLVGKNEPFVSEDKSSRSSEDEGDSMNQSGLKPGLLELDIARRVWSL